MIGRALKATALGAGAVASTAALGLTSAEATAGRTVRLASHISIRNHGLRFGGRVTSSNGACESARKVTLYRTNGDVLGSTQTNNRGHWNIRAEGSAGISLEHFYAVVKRESQGTAGTIYVCKKAKSATIPFR